MDNPRFRRAAHLNRAKAVIITLVFHVALFGAIAMSGEGDISTKVKGWFGMDKSDKIEQAAAQKVNQVEKDEKWERP